MLEDNLTDDAAPTKNPYLEFRAAYIKVGELLENNFRIL